MNIYILIGTPLCRHIREVIARIETMESTLRENGQRACVIIATDGESSDGDIAAVGDDDNDNDYYFVLYFL